MKTYKIQVNHDHGSIVLQTHASSIEDAKAQVCAAERCPASALGWWQVIPTARQVKRTQSLLRCL